VVDPAGGLRESAERRKHCAGGDSPEESPSIHQNAVPQSEGVTLPGD
jgi:hypothetical protein